MSFELNPDRSNPRDSPSFKSLAKLFSSPDVSISSHKFFQDVIVSSDDDDSASECHESVDCNVVSTPTLKSDNIKHSYPEAKTETVENPSTQIVPNSYTTPTTDATDSNLHPVENDFRQVVTPFSVPSTPQSEAEVTNSSSTLPLNCSIEVLSNPSDNTNEKQSSPGMNTPIGTTVPEPVCSSTESTRNSCDSTAFTSAKRQQNVTFTNIPDDKCSEDSAEIHTDFSLNVTRKAYQSEFSPNSTLASNDHSVTSLNDKTPSRKTDCRDKLCQYCPSYDAVYAEQYFKGNICKICTILYSP